MAGWHHQRNGYEFEQALGDTEGQGSLVCCMQSLGSQSDATLQPNNNSRRRHWRTKLDLSGASYTERHTFLLRQGPLHLNGITEHYCCLNNSWEKWDVWLLVFPHSVLVAQK